MLNVHYRVLAFSVFALVSLLFLNGFQSYRSINELTVNEKRANNTQAILKALKDVYSAIQDAELGLRAYLISNDPEHLKPYFESLVAIKNHFDILEALQPELPGQALRVGQLKSIIQNRLGDLTNDISETSVNADSEWLTDHNLNQSHESMVKLSLLINDMESVEYELLNRQSIESRQSRSRALFTIAVANSALFILILISAAVIKRSIDRQQAEAELLELKVNQRTFELQHASDELKQSNRELQDFAFVASHDLQEPLRKIRAFGDRLNSRFGDQLGEDGADYIRRMQNAAERMSNLIGDLLEFSRVSTRSDPNQTVDLNQILEEVQENLEVTIDERKASIEISELPTIEADPAQMKQLFQNLLSNALKFTDKDTAPEITISAIEKPEPYSVTDSKMYEIAVKDNGIGFEEKYLDRIFTPFQRLHGRNEYAGTGIGLSICRKIVERHHGQLTASSAVGRGTTFYIRLPSVQASLNTDKSESANSS